MNTWKSISIKGIARINKVVAEFDVYELQKTPYGKFKVKVYEQSDGSYIGYTNLQVIDSTGSYYCGVGYGSTVHDTLEDTIYYFLSMLDREKIWNEADFMYCDPNDF